MRRSKMDVIGVTGMAGFALMMALNQVVIKLVNGGIQPVFAAGLRSLGAVICLWIWMRLRRKPLDWRSDTLASGILIGIFFALEFLFLFNGLDLTSVSRSVVILYSMPVWFSLAGHFLVPGEALNRWKILGLAIALSGVVLAMSDQSGGQVNWRGDLMVLGAALSWTGIAVCARGTKLQYVSPETQLMWQLVVSVPILLGLAPLFGPLFRELVPAHI